MNQQPATILTIGDELLSGDVVDTNSAYLAAQLSQQGFRVTHKYCVGDERGDVICALEQCVQTTADCALVVVTGGLGPTTDDLTRDAVAAYCGEELVLNQESLERIKTYFAKRKRPFTETNTRQAYFPRGAQVIENPAGTADAFIVEGSRDPKRRIPIICLPGVPREVKEIFREKLLPWFQQNFPGRETPVCSIIKCFGLSEAYIGSLIEQAGLAQNVRVAYRPAWPEIMIKFSIGKPVREGSQKEALALATEKAIAQIGQAFIYTTDPNESMADCVGRLLLDRKLTLAVAESCTGGEIASRIVSTPGASAYFLTSIVSYSNDAKEVFLGVTKPLLETYGAVSEEVVTRMARHVRSRIGADIGLAITGIAGPSGATAEKPAGTVWIGLATSQGEQTFCHYLPVARNLFRSYCAMLALDLVRRKLLGYELEWERR